jgi:hypothetical protein
MTKKKPAAGPAAPALAPEIRPGQSVELLKELHILTREGKLNQDSRRKLKQVYHLFQFIEKILQELQASKAGEGGLTLADHGAGKSYLGFMHAMTWYFRAEDRAGRGLRHRDTRRSGRRSSRALADRAWASSACSFLHLSAAEARTLSDACRSASTWSRLCMRATRRPTTPSPLRLRKQARAIALVPCCQAEVPPRSAPAQSPQP